MERFPPWKSATRMGLAPTPLPPACLRGTARPRRATGLGQAEGPRGLALHAVDLCRRKLARLFDELLELRHASNLTKTVARRGPRATACLPGGVPTASDARGSAAPSPAHGLKVPLSSARSAAGRPQGRRRSPEDQDVGVDVRSVGPHDGAQLLVHADGPKEGGVLPDWLEHRTVQVRPKVDLSGRAVGQREAHSEAPERLDATNPDHTVMLLQASKGQRGGRLTRRSCPAASPPPRTWSIRVACPSGSGSRVQTMIPECSGERRADDELPPVEGQDRAPEPSGFGKDVLVPNTLVS